MSISGLHSKQRFLYNEEVHLAKQFFYNEWQSFQQLSKQGQTLIIATALFNIINPIFNLFASSFIWRQSQDIELVALYNLMFYVGMPIGSYINGLLLKKYTPTRLYVIGAGLQAVVMALLIFLAIVSLPSVILFGLSIGIFASLLWSNRNLLLLQATSTHNRIYYSSLDFTLATVSNILTPILIGTFIIWGSTHQLYTPMQAYYAVSLLTFVFVFFIARVMKNIPSQRPDIRQITLRRPHPSWRKARKMNICIGLLYGSNSIFPILLVLSFIGNEGALGTVQSVSAILSGTIVYIIGRRVDPQERVWVILASIILLLAAAITFILMFSSLGIIILLMLQAVAIPLLAISGGAMILDLIDENKENNDYAYIFDSEFFLNLGKIVSIVGFLALIALLSSKSALQYMPLILAASQFILFYLAKSIDDKHVRHLAQRYLPDFITTFFKR